MPNGLLPLAKNINKHRNKLSISQDRLSKLADVALHTLTRIESGATSDSQIETVNKIANALSAMLDV
jgi:predicted transcriptional regulator